MCFILVTFKFHFISLRTEQSLFSKKMRISFQYETSPQVNDTTALLYPHQIKIIMYDPARFREEKVIKSNINIQHPWVESQY